MQQRTRFRRLVGVATAATALVTVLGVPAPAAVAQTAATAHAPRTSPAARSTPLSAPDAKALRAALAGLPHADTTAALVRVGGTDGRWRGSAGVADLRTGRAALPDGRFRAGSTTKVFTAAVVLQLVAEGRVSLEARVTDQLPGLLPERYAGVTVGQLLNHTSGLPPADLPAGDFAEQYRNRYATTTPEALVASATAKPPEFAPGARQHYLNINYTVLGLLVEKLTGHSYEHEAGVRVIKPLGLRHTSLPGTDPRIGGPHNHGYQKVPAKGGGTRLLDVTEWNSSASWAAGDLVSTTADLERLLGALFRGEVVPKATLEHMFTVPDVPMYDADHPDETDPDKLDPATYSMGLTRLPLPDGRVVWGKSGGRYGYSTLLAGTRDLSRTLVYNVNATDAKSTAPNPTIDKLTAAALS